MAHIQSATMEVTQRGQELLQVRKERRFFTFLLWENIGQYLLSLSLARDREGNRGTDRPRKYLLSLPPLREWGSEEPDP